MKVSLLLAAILFIASATCNGSDAPVVYRPSELNKLEHKLDGETVTVKGWLVVGREKYGDEYGIWEDKAHHDENSDPNSCVTIFFRKKDLSRLKKYTHKIVQVTGTFRRNFDKEEHLWFQGGCDITGVVLPEGVLIESR